MEKMKELREFVEEYIAEVEEHFDDESDEYKCSILNVLEDMIVYAQNTENDKWRAAPSN